MKVLVMTVDDALASYHVITYIWAYALGDECPL